MSVCVCTGNEEAMSMLHLISHALEHSPAGAQMPSLTGGLRAAQVCHTCFYLSSTVGAGIKAGVCMLHGGRMRGLPIRLHGA